MRPIKFRAWVEGFNVDQTGMFQPTFVGLHGDGTVERIWTDKYKFKDYEEKITLMQFTGLHDKNGTEIYEGDVCFGRVRSTTSKPEAWQVIYQADKGAFCYKAKNGIVNPLTHAFSISRELEVIGNIHENSELLNKETK